MSDAEVTYIRADLHLPNIGDVAVRFLSTYGATIDTLVSSANMHTNGWISVERNDGDSWIGEKWTPIMVNLSHFAIISPVEVTE